MSENGQQRKLHRVLTDTEIASIRESSLAVLEEVGIVIQHQRALSLLAEAGASVDPHTHIVKIPASLVERALRTAPPEFLITGQNPSKDLVIGHNSPPRGRPGISLDWIVDYGEKRRREVAVKDLEAWVRVADALPNLCMVSAVYPWDVPIETRDILVAAAMFRLSDKPILMAPYSGWSVKWIAQMLAAIGDQRGPRIVAFCSANSPLIFSESQMGVLLGAVECDFPVMVNSSGVTGATAPVTLAGTLVIMNAEILAGIVVAQLVRPGAAIMYAGHPVVLDMRTAIASMGYTEVGLLATALVELGRSYSFPTASNGLTTDSHVCDEQAAIEKMMTGYMPVLCGAALNGGAGSLAAVGTASLEQLVIDDDIYERLFRFSEGISVNKDTLALDVIAAVGPNRQFLEEPHTLKYLRREFRHSKLASRLNAGVWIDRGGKDAVDVAADRVKTILSSSPELRLDPQILAELSHIVASAEQEKHKAA
ncbi:MAG: trimethylamine methyltransferase family protein [Terriglobia bacterium]|jgi:trimethylamine--corrinoid protein Co-methyltransferase